VATELTTLAKLPEDAREFMADLLALEIERVALTFESHHAALC